jgi:hypothetical protein
LTCYVNWCFLQHILMEMKKTNEKVALFMMSGRSSLWQSFLVGYVWQYEVIYGTTAPSKARKLLA